MAIRILNNSIISIFGWILSAYSIYVEYRVAETGKNPDGEEFVALCDIEAIGASCSSVFALPEGKLLSFFGLVPSGHILDVPNGMLGIFFYTYIFIRCCYSASSAKQPFLIRSDVNLVISFLAITSSIFLGWKLFSMKELCVLCLSTHLINTTLFYRSVKEILMKRSAVFEKKSKSK